MFFDHKRIYEACLSDLDDPEQIEAAFRFFYGDTPAPHPVDDRREFLQRFLKSLPPASEQLKIADRLHELAQAQGAAIRGIHWWDIAQGEMSLRLQVHKEGYDILVTLYWKKAIKNERFFFSSSSSMVVRRIPRVTGDWVVSFEALTYADVKGQFDVFLRKPLSEVIDLDSNNP